MQNLHSPSYTIVFLFPLTTSAPLPKSEAPICIVVWSCAGRKREIELLNHLGCYQVRIFTLEARDSVDNLPVQGRSFHYPVFGNIDCFSVAFISRSERLEVLSGPLLIGRKLSELRFSLSLGLPQITNVPTLLQKHLKEFKKFPVEDILSQQCF